jgi:hypothetical protein
MNMKCDDCGLVNPPGTLECRRCGRIVAWTGTKYEAAKPARSPWGRVITGLFSMIVVSAAVNFAYPYIKQSSPVEWKEYRSSISRLKVSMPGEPDMKTQSLETPNGSVTATMYGCTVPHQGIAAFVVMTLPNSGHSSMTEEEMLTNGMQGAVASLRGTLVTSEKLSLESYTGRAFELSLPKDDKNGFQRAWIRTYLVEGKAYVFMLVSRTDSEFANARQQFFDSIALAK